MAKYMLPILIAAGLSGSSLLAMAGDHSEHVKASVRPQQRSIPIKIAAAGAAVAASLLTRKPDLDIAIIDPAETHYYQPGWTFVGAGIFSPAQTAKAMASALPRRASATTTSSSAQD